MLVFRLITITLSLILIILPGCSGNQSVLTANAVCSTSWPEWLRFRQMFVTPEGRVVDHSTPNKQTVSEGQGYAMFFALAANDRSSFDNLLRWTENNLAGGDLTTRLPAWQWGQRNDGSWGVLDMNSASDADLWLAYTLGIAGEVWNDRRYSRLSHALAQRILNEETENIPGLGLTLLPAPYGFTLPNRSWKLNASYLPIQLLRWFAQNDSDSRWNKLIQSSNRIILSSAPRGYAADWVVYSQEKGFQPDAVGLGEGSYDAIRVYLWAGMLSEHDDLRPALLKTLQPMAVLTEAKTYPPEYVDVLTGEVKSPASAGFSAALLPFLESSNAHSVLEQQRQRVQKQGIRADVYYDQALYLFSSGWQSRRFRFQGNGDVRLSWVKSCTPGG